MKNIWDTTLISHVGFLFLFGVSRVEQVKWIILALKTISTVVITAGVIISAIPIKINVDDEHAKNYLIENKCKLGSKFLFIT